MFKEGVKSHQSAYFAWFDYNDVTGTCNVFVSKALCPDILGMKQEFDKQMQLQGTKGKGKGKGNKGKTGKDDGDDSTDDDMTADELEWKRVQHMFVEVDEEEIDMKGKGKGKGDRANKGSGKTKGPGKDTRNWFPYSFEWKLVGDVTTDNGKWQNTRPWKEAWNASIEAKVIQSKRFKRF